MQVIINEGVFAIGNMLYIFSDNTNFMIGKNESLLKLIKDAQSELPQKVFDVGCPCHLAHLCAQKGANAFSNAS